ncbi:hypothetical protein [Corynebacterium singulare]|uniref:Uncharacterized protein n=1 Tax=Corynebacterium singulare TaxID=161899 RepID=A0ABS9PW10_9CORY|nr:hypothetical protein [Corynebacterium singulare]MCG7276898.1 hypothetical protein [Corynebacterium singulare]
MRSVSLLPTKPTGSVLWNVVSSVRLTNGCLEVATQMMADSLDYQLSAVKSALSDERL